MNRLSLTAVAGGLIVLASCSQEEVATGGKKTNEDLPISFRAGVGTRVNPEHNYENGLYTFYVSAYSPNHMSDTGVTPDSLFWDEPFYLMGANLYASSSNYKWPGNTEKIEFFAYAPSLEDIQQAAFTQLDPTDPNYAGNLASYTKAIQFFNLCNDNVPLDPMGQMNTTFNNVTLYKGFKLGRFYVATDISKQVDFITSHISANKPNEEQAKIGIALKFMHQLSNIELRAFGNHPDYNIEIAGVRIGRPYTGNAIFNFCDGLGGEAYAAGGQWGISKNPQRMPVEYIFGEGDEIYRMGRFNNMNGGAVMSSTPHTTSALAESIMGKGGNAMVLPTKNGPWAGINNPWISPKYSAFSGSGEDPYPNQNPDPWSADAAYGDMYFSVLIRVTLKPTENELTTAQIYPYGNTTNFNVVYLEKEKGSNKIIGRLPSKTAAVGPNNEVAQFGWASVPVGVNWERGKKYIYTLDFSEGVGVQDPEDPKPGTPIIGNGIKFKVEVANWDEQTNGTSVPKE